MMGNRFIEALSKRYKRLSSAPQLEKIAAERATPEGAEQAVPAERTAQESRDQSGEALGPVSVSAETPASKESEPASWQLVLPGYEFSGGSLRAKVAAANSASNAPSEKVTDLQNDEGKSAAWSFWSVRSFGVMSVGLSVGCLITLLCVRLVDGGAQPAPSRVDPVLASTQLPCPPAPVETACRVSSVKNLPLLASAVADAPGALTDSALPEERAPEIPAPVAQVAAAEIETDRGPMTKPAKSKPKPRSRIEMETRQVMVSGRAVAAVVMLKRVGSKQGRTRVRWKTLPGTATPAKDYQGASTTVQFADGQAQRTIFVPILQQPPGAVVQSRTFSVVLERAPRGSPLGSVTSTTVTILGDG